MKYLVIVWLTCMLTACQTTEEEDPADYQQELNKAKMLYVQCLQELNNQKAKYQRECVK